jgi:hypothetical protein
MINSLASLLLERVPFLESIICFGIGIFLLLTTFRIIKIPTRINFLNGKFIKPFAFIVGALLIYHSYNSFNQSQIKEAKNKLATLSIVNSEDYALGLISEDHGIRNLVRKTGFNLHSKVEQKDALTFLIVSDKFNASKLVEIIPKNFPNDRIIKFRLDNLCGYNSFFVCEKLFNKNPNTSYELAIYVGALSSINELNEIGAADKKIINELLLINSNLEKFRNDFFQIKVSFNTCLRKISQDSWHLCGKPIKNLEIFNAAGITYEYESYDDCKNVVGEKDFARQCEYIRDFHLDKMIKPKNLINAATAYLISNGFENYSKLDSDATRIKKIISTLKQKK